MLNSSEGTQAKEKIIPPDTSKSSENPVPCTENSAVADAYYKLGLERYDMDDLDGAIANFTRAIECNPRHVRAYHMRGNVHRERGNLEGAAADASKVLELDSLEETSGEHEPAMEQGRIPAEKLQQGKEAAPADEPRKNEEASAGTDAIALFKLGLERYDMDDLEGAIEAFSKAIDLSPRYTRAYHMRALVRREKGDLEGAEHDSNTVIELDAE